jgi:hypothetical protein
MLVGKLVSFGLPWQIDRERLCNDIMNTGVSVTSLAAPCILHAAY